MTETVYTFENLYRLVDRQDENTVGDEEVHTGYTYDALGNMLTLTDPVDNVTTWAYDDLGRVELETVTIDSTDVDREFARVLKPDGFLLITLPDLEEVAKHIARGNLEEPLYVSPPGNSPAGPISPIDILFGHRQSMAQVFSENSASTRMVSTALLAVPPVKALAILG